MRHFKASRPLSSCVNPLRRIAKPVTICRSLITKRHCSRCERREDSATERISPVDTPYILNDATNQELIACLGETEHTLIRTLSSRDLARGDKSLRESKTRFEIYAGPDRNNPSKKSSNGFI